MKIEYTYQNHFKFGYEPEIFFQSRKDESQKFTFQYGKVQTDRGSWRSSNKSAARQIRDHFGADLWLLFSGGTDSECCALSFLEAGIPIRLLSLRMKNGLNSHDLEHAEKFAKEKSLKIDFVDLDVEQFIQSEELLKITDPIQCVSPILGCHLWLAQQAPGIPILAQGECYLRKVIPADYVAGVSPYLPSEWRLVESERLCALYMHFILQQKPAVPGFFQYNPEQIDSFLRLNPLLQRLVQNLEVGKLGTRTSKNRMVRQFYPEISERQKWTGFEKIEKLHDLVRKKLADRYPASDQDSEISYETLLANLRP